MGALIKGKLQNREKQVFIYNICDHAQAYADVDSQAIAFTAGVPALWPGLAGARSVESRGGRLSVTGIELDSEAAGVLAERVEGAVYEWREKTAAVRVPDEPEARLAAVLAMAEGIREAKRAPAGTAA